MKTFIHACTYPSNVQKILRPRTSYLISLAFVLSFSVASCPSLFVVDENISFRWRIGLCDSDVMSFQTSGFESIFHVPTGVAGTWSFFVFCLEWSSGGKLVPCNVSWRLLPIIVDGMKCMNVSCRSRGPGDRVLNSLTIMSTWLVSSTNTGMPVNRISVKVLCRLRGIASADEAASVMPELPQSTIICSRYRRRRVQCVEDPKHV